MAEKTPPRDIVSPSNPSSDLPVLTTPMGGRLYNPFHEDYVARLDGITVTPGLFAPSDRSVARTEAVKSIPFFWSPEIKGDHFPTEIDENLTHQLQMQQKLDADVEEAAQSKIASYFQSNVVAPSPDVTIKPLKELLSGKPTLHRTSSLKPIFTSGSGNEEQAGQRTVVVTDVKVQTSISVAPDTDLPSLLQRAMGLEEKENVLCGGESSSLYRYGVTFSEASADHTEDPYPRYPSVMYSSCLRENLPNYRKRRSLFSESFDVDTLRNATSSSVDARSVHDTHFISADDMEAMADDLGLPVNWASESVSLSSRHQCKRSPEDIDRFKQSSATNLTGLLEHAGIGSCRTLSCEPQKSHLFGSMSPLVGGRTSPEARGLQRPLPLSSIMNDEDDEYDGGDEESTRDSCKSFKRQCGHGSRKRRMASPDLSPIYRPCGNPLMDQDSDNYVDVDALPGTVAAANNDSESNESAL
ncbi:unnamed protein product [Hydatigera taeniaeformis]|uniref:Protein aurora borealis n=1 Tax=Hydatigena taeniaeformis TaxID=6205 RepID=A0A0R3X7S9_HYDTA|nr:unnamed protein product [Hydatigera taeniaeformis]